MESMAVIVSLLSLYAYRYLGKFLHVNTSSVDSFCHFLNLQLYDSCPTVPVGARKYCKDCAKALSAWLHVSTHAQFYCPL